MKKETRKLTVNKQVLRTLSGAQLDAIPGGAEDPQVQVWTSVISGCFKKTCIC